MPVYRYALQKDAGPNEHLGSIEIPCDQDATDFGREVVIDILQDPDPAFARATLEISEGARTVDSVPLKSELRRKT